MVPSNPCSLRSSRLNRVFPCWVPSATREQKPLSLVPRDCAERMWKKECRQRAVVVWDVSDSSYPCSIRCFRQEQTSQDTKGIRHMVTSAWFDRTRLKALIACRNIPSWQTQRNLGLPPSVAALQEKWASTEVWSEL